MTFRIGFTGTRHGMSDAQATAVAEALAGISAAHLGYSCTLITVRHGGCVGSDEQFHNICRRVIPESGLRIICHPGPDWPNGPLCARVSCDEVMPNAPYMTRNRAIVDASYLMIATPSEDVPQKRGGTWKTIGMALRSLRADWLQFLWVYGRDGKKLDHSEWEL